jgi:hypothetical protein
MPGSRISLEPGMLTAVIFLALLIGTFAYAFRAGGRHEKEAAVISICAALLSLFAAHHGGRLWHGSENGILVVDLLTLVGFGWIMFRSNNFWPIWVTAFQLLTVIAHIGPKFRHGWIAGPFAAEEECWSWVILLQIVLATRLRQR